jgi:hypothetical protein
LLTDRAKENASLLVSDGSVVQFDGGESERESESNTAKKIATEGARYIDAQIQS